MRKLVVLLFLGIIAFPSISLSQVYGTLKGKVVDDDGKGLRGASVFVEGTQKGAAVRENDGSYIITGISAGEYTVRFSFTGKSTVRKEIRISPSLTTTLDITLRDQSVKTDELVVIAKRELVNVGKQGSMDRKTNEDIINTAREGLSGVITMSAGVLASGTGFSIRGGRAEETDVRVDGMSVSNAFSGGFGVSGAAYYPMVSAYATEEFQVLKGGFSAEYGDVTSGVINSAVQTGKDDHYAGWIRWRTDVPALWGSQSTGTSLLRDGTRYKAIDEGEGAKLQGSDENTFEFGTGGPLPFLSKGNTFYLSGKYFHETYRDNSYEIIDPWGNNWGQMPNNGSWVRNLTGRMKLAVADNLSLLLGGSYGVSSFEFSSRAWLYANNEGYVYNKNEAGDFILQTNDDGTPKTNGMAERLFKQNVWDNFVINYFALITHTLSPESFYEIRISNSTNNDYQGRRKNTDGPGFFSGWDIQMPTDQYKVLLNKLVPGQDKIVDQYTLIPETAKTADGYLRMSMPLRNPITGYFEGSANQTGTNNPWGLPNQGLYTSGSTYFQFREGSNWTLDGSFTQLFSTGEFAHNFKTGFQGTIYEMYKHANYSPYDGQPFFDVYDDGRFGGNLYADDEVVKERTNKGYTPVKIGLYFQDQIEYKGIVISPGLRFDYFDPSSQYRTTLDPFVSIKADSGFAAASAKVQVSPRINIAYPITETSNIRLSYGMYFQMPLLNYMYDNYGIDVLRSNNTLGDPNLEAQRTNQYEVEYNLALTDDLVFSATTYYKDIYNQLGVMYIPTVPNPYWQYVTAEYGSSRGIELNLRKQPMPTENFSFDLNYNLGFLTGTASGPGSNAGFIIDPYTDKPAFPLSEYPMDNDLRHYLNANLRFYWLDEQGPSIGGIKLLENTDIILTSSYRSGYPYTRTDRNGVAVAERNADRLPSEWRFDARLSRTIKLNDIFGESAGNTSVQLFVDVTNLLNRTVVRSFYTATGDPLDDGRTFDRQVGDFNSTTYYKDANFENSATFASSQYDLYGNRLYNEMADFDKNGMVTQAETFESYYKYIETIVSIRGNFQAPRTVYFGMMFNF